jgi:hypothetical protein
VVTRSGVTPVTALAEQNNALAAARSRCSLSNETIVIDQASQPLGDTIDLNGVTLGAGSALLVENPSGNNQDIASIDIGGTLTVDARAQVAPDRGSSKAWWPTPQAPP